MEWFEGTPRETEFNLGLFFVRIEQSELGCKSIKFGTHVWYGDRWRPLRYDGDKITHYAYIDDPISLEGNNFYEDELGRLKCVVQEEVLPDLSTPPVKRS